MKFFFDLDGTILDVSDKYYQLYLSILKELNCKSLNKKSFWDLKRKDISNYEILSKTTSGNFEKKYEEKFIQNIEKEQYLKYDIIWPELKDIYFQLFEKYDCFLVTLRKNERSLIKQLETLNILHLFTDILFDNTKLENYSHKWEIKKNIISLKFGNKNFDKNEYFFIGDTPTDIIAGKYFQIKTIALSFGMRNRTILTTAFPDLIFSSCLQFKKFLKNKFFKSF